MIPRGRAPYIYIAGTFHPQNKPEEEMEEGETKMEEKYTLVCFLHVSNTKS